MCRFLNIARWWIVVAPNRSIFYENFLFFCLWYAVLMLFRLVLTFILITYYRINFRTVSKCDSIKFDPIQFRFFVNSDKCCIEFELRSFASLWTECMRNPFKFIWVSCFGSRSCTSHRLVGEICYLFYIQYDWCFLSNWINQWGDLVLIKILFSSLSHFILFCFIFT